MKVDAPGPVTPDILTRMREAAAVAPSDQIAAPRVSESPMPAAAPEAAAMRGIAERAIRGEFPDSTAVRTEVVEELLRLRWSAHLPAEELGQMLHELTPTLIDDPAFVREVDELLLLAARELDTR